MDCEVRRDREQRRPAGRLSLQFPTGKGPKESGSNWRFSPRSCPREDGTRRIRLEARSTSNTLTADLTAGEAVDLMFELGAALEQAARDQQWAKNDLPALEAVDGGRA